MSNLTSNLTKTLSRATLLMLPLLFIPIGMQSGAVAPRVVCGAEAAGGNCEFAFLKLCDDGGEILQDAMPVH